MTTRRWLPIALAALALLSSGAEAQIRIRRTLTVDTGLVQTQVLAIFEDRDGYLWFGTNDGVSRYDGVELAGFQSLQGLPPGPVRAIGQSTDGALFFATDRGLSIYENGRFAPPPPESGLRDGEVRSIARTGDGRLFFVRWDGPVVVRHPEGRWERLHFDGLLAAAKLTVALPARDGALFLGTELGTEKGAFVAREGRVSPVSGLDGLAILSIHETRDGRVYFGTYKGLFFYRGGLASPIRGVGAPAGPVMGIEDGTDGALYLATYDGVRIGRGDPLAFDALTRENGLAWDQVHAVHETRDGAVYIATERGVSVWDRGLVESWTPATGLPDALVWSIAEDAGGGMWLGTGNGLALLRDGRWRSFGMSDGLPGVTVRTVHAGPSGRVYAGTQQGGLAIYEDGRFRVLDRRSGLPDNFVRAVWEAPDGAVYIGTQAGLSILREGQIRTLGPQDGLPHPMVNALAPGPDGALWIGTLRGLARYQGGEMKVWRERDGLPDDNVWSVRPGRNGEVYLGTAKGLAVLRGGKFRTIDARGSSGPRLTNDTVYCVAQDAAGRVYASTNRGVNIIENLLGPSPVTVRDLQAADGLASVEANLGACLRDSRGRLWFGTVGGASVYDPSREWPGQEAPRVRISGARLFDRELDPAALEGRRFGSQDNYFQFAFVGIDLAAPHRVRYRYRLAGLDRAWIETDRRSVQYTNLDPGRYRFQVQAASGPGIWSRPAELPFTILTPLWRRWWFLLLVALAVGSAAAMLLAFRVRQLLAIERLRTAIAADLHDHIGAGLTEISILSEIVAHRQKGEAPPELARVADTARQLIDRMNDIVWLVNPRRDSLHELFLRLKDSYSELFSHAGVLFRTSNLSLFERVRLPMAYRENLYLIFKEALNNSLRHSGCQEIELAVELQGRNLEVVLKDDGRGFDPRGGRGNGLDNMKDRARRIGGDLSIETTRGGGTAVRFAGVLP